MDVTGGQVGQCLTSPKVSWGVVRELEQARGLSSEKPLAGCLLSRSGLLFVKITIHGYQKTQINGTNTAVVSSNRQTSVVTARPRCNDKAWPQCNRVWETAVCQVTTVVPTDWFSGIGHWLVTFYHLPLRDRPLPDRPSPACSSTTAALASRWPRVLGVDHVFWTISSSCHAHFPEAALLVEQTHPCGFQGPLYELRPYGIWSLYLRQFMLTDVVLYVQERRSNSLLSQNVTLWTVFYEWVASSWIKTQMSALTSQKDS